MSTKRPGRPRRPNPDKAAAIWYDSLGGLEPLEILDHATEAKKVFNQYVRDAELVAVKQLRDSGASWQYIGEIFGTSKQSAWERFGKELNQLDWGPGADAEPETAATQTPDDQDANDDAAAEDDWIAPATIDHDQHAETGQWADDTPAATAGYAWASAEPTEEDAAPQQTPATL